MTTDRVYFIRHPKSGLVKVGYSGNVPARLRQLERDEGCPLELLAVTGGGRPREQELHAAMPSFRERGEWFRPNSLIAHYIDLIQGHVADDTKRVVRAVGLMTYQLIGLAPVVSVADVCNYDGGFWQGWEGF